MSRRPLQYPVFQAFASDETFLESGTATFYFAGTTTKKSIYQDADLTVEAPNPVTLNARGEPQSAGGTPINIYLDGGSYKIVIEDSSGTTLRTVDNYTESLTTDLLEEAQVLANSEVYENTTDGLAGTTDGDYFWVPNNGNLLLYRNASGSATQVSEFPSQSSIDDTLNAAIQTANIFDDTTEGLNNTEDGDYFTVPEDRGLVLYKNNSGTADEILVFSGPGPSNPPDATDQGTDVYEGSLNQDPSSGESFKIDFQSTNTTTTPTFENTSGVLGALTMKTRRGEALWANAIQGEHRLYYDGTDYLVLDPSTQPLSETSNVTFNGVTITGDLSATGDVDFTGTGSVQIPVGTTAQRPGTPTEGDIRRNTTTGQFEGYTGTEWGPFGGGATGGGSDQVFVQNDQTVTEDYTIPADKNAMTTGPITVASGVTVTVASGARWVVI